MKQKISGQLNENPRNFMRRAGYGETRGFKGQMSYTRRLSGAKFPRFHAYLDEGLGGFDINLHLDQKPHNLGSGAAHGGEYDGELVENEMARLVVLASQSAGETGETKKKYYDDDLPLV